MRMFSQNMERKGKRGKVAGGGWFHQPHAPACLRRLLEKHRTLPFLDTSHDDDSESGSGFIRRELSEIDK
jgi:hypothetical protein